MRRFGLRRRIALSYLATSALIAVILIGLSTAILFGVGFGSPHLGDPLGLFLGLSTMAVLLVVIAPIGATVGVLTMRGTVHRLGALLEASRALAARNVRLEERTQMARDLHDSVSQDLFALRMRLAGLGLQYPDDSELRQQL